MYFDIGIRPDATGGKHGKSQRARHRSKGRSGNDEDHRRDRWSQSENDGRIRPQELAADEIRGARCCPEDRLRHPKRSGRHP